jgi:hypothetical protein
MREGRSKGRWGREEREARRGKMRGERRKLRHRSAAAGVNAAAIDEADGDLPLDLDAAPVRPRPR